MDRRRRPLRGYAAPPARRTEFLRGRIDVRASPGVAGWPLGTLTLAAGRWDGHWSVTAASSAISAAPQRLATLEDAPAISELMRVSTLELFPRFYDERQTASGAVHIAHLDLQLIEDGTYFVHEAGGEIVACGGWSRRNKLYTGRGDAQDDLRFLDPATEPARVRAMFVRGDWTRRGLGRAILESCERAARQAGFRKLVLGATLAGEPLYRAFGFRETGRANVPMPDGVEVEVVSMERPISPA